jgi:hypothetical protein
MGFVTFALMMAGVLVGFLAGLGVGWYARPALVEIHLDEVESRDELQAGDNEIVRFVAPDGRVSYTGHFADPEPVITPTPMAPPPAPAGYGPYPAAPVVVVVHPNQPGGWTP